MATGFAGPGGVHDPTCLLQRVADQAVELIAAADGALIGLSDNEGVSFVCGSGYLTAHLGTSVALASSLAGQTVRTKELLRSDNTEEDPRVDREACREMSVLSTVCVPLCRGASAMGVLCVSAKRSHAFSDADVALLSQLADFLGVAVGLVADLARVGDELGRARGRSPAAPAPAVEPTSGLASRFVLSVLRPEALQWVEARARAQSVLETPERLSMVFQPVFDLSTGRAAMVEALARFDCAPYRSPDAWFAEAGL